MASRYGYIIIYINIYYESQSIYMNISYHSYDSPAG